MRAGFNVRVARIKTYFINLLAALLANGITIMLVGKATINPITHALRNAGKNCSVNPTFILVMVKVIVVSKAKVIKKATNIPKYLLLIPNFPPFSNLF